MYVIVAYDVSVERVNKVKSYLRTQLTWVQNSVFEGDLSKARQMELLDKLNKIIDPKSDAITIYSFPTKKSLSRLDLGVKKGDPEERVI
ncbi:MAG: CRISPR-associated endonuclease Cas2 [Candidatus Heimdallarchaeota archaeon]|nr:CRISPR-associated endonuclease Cas2 [Candidatus Heimdallarchaeota archaeon]